MVSVLGCRFLGLGKTTVCMKGFRSSFFLHNGVAWVSCGSVVGIGEIAKRKLQRWLRLYFYGSLVLFKPLSCFFAVVLCCSGKGRIACLSVSCLGEYRTGSSFCIHFPDECDSHEPIPRALSRDKTYEERVSLGKYYNLSFPCT